MDVEQPLPPVLGFGYLIQRLLGKGGMGNVYLAKQQSLDRQVALKILHPHRARNLAAVASFLREARNAAMLNHPNLAVVHDVHADEAMGLYCFAMEYVEGETASQMVARHGPVPAHTALHLILQVAKALGYAHRHGIVHRDVKPDNIMVTPSFEAKLLDLGLVQDRILAGGSDHQRILTLVGTLEYSAPEQHRNPANAVPASDVYSLGMSLYHLLTGVLPFHGQTAIDLIVRMATEPVSYPISLPGDCRQLLMQMLTKNPADRLGDGDAVVEAIQHIAGRLPEHSSTVHTGHAGHGGQSIPGSAEPIPKPPSGIGRSIHRRRLRRR